MTRLAVLVLTFALIIPFALPTANHQSNIGGVWTNHPGNSYSCLVA